MRNRLLVANMSACINKRQSRATLLSISLSAYPSVEKRHNDSRLWHMNPAAAFSKRFSLKAGLSHILGLTCVSFPLSVYRLRVHGPVLTRCSGSSPPVPGTGRQHWGADWASPGAQLFGVARQTTDWSVVLVIEPDRQLIGQPSPLCSQTDSWLVVALRGEARQTGDWPCIPIRWSPTDRWLVIHFRGGSKQISDWPVAMLLSVSGGDSHINSAGLKEQYEHYEPHSIWSCFFLFSFFFPIFFLWVVSACAFSDCSLTVTTNTAIISEYLKSKLYSILVFRFMACDEIV